VDLSVIVPPLLLLSVLLPVLGAQIFALGLVAEIIGYSHLPDVKAHAVEEILG
jgi:hypothetical protein